MPRFQQICHDRLPGISCRNAEELSRACNRECKNKMCVIRTIAKQASEYFFFLSLSPFLQSPCFFYYTTSKRHKELRDFRPEQHSERFLGVYRKKQRLNLGIHSSVCCFELHWHYRMKHQCGFITVSLHLPDLIPKLYISNLLLIFRLNSGFLLICLS